MAVDDAPAAGAQPPLRWYKVATLDDLVFLPANLSRLVIDPYRDACNVGTEIGGALELADGSAAQAAVASARAPATASGTAAGERSLGMDCMDDSRGLERSGDRFLCHRRCPRH